MMEKNMKTQAEACEANAKAPLENLKQHKHGRLKHPYLLFFLSGLLFSVPFALGDLGFLIFLSGIPFSMLFYYAIWQNKTQKFRFVFRYTLSAFFGFFLGVFQWLIALYPLDFVGLGKGASVVIILAGLIVIPLLQATGFSFLGLHLACFARKIARKRNALLFPLILASLFAVYAFTQTLTWMGLPWASLGITLVDMPKIALTASLFGSFFLSFLIVFINASLALALFAFFASKKKTAMLSFAMAFLLFGANILAGSLLYAKPLNAEHVIKCAVIQGNKSSKDAHNDTPSSLFNHYINLSEKAIKDGAEFILWPETALTFLLYPGGSYEKRLADFAKDNNVFLALGCYRIPETDPLGYTNAVMLFYPDGSLSEPPYLKRKLVPFGEYLPWEPFFSLFPFVDELRMFDTPIYTGTEPNLFTTPFGDVGTIICYDSVFPRFCRESVKAGAELILLPTNDSWFSDSQAGYQHHRQAILRAMENGKYLMRAGNTGISSFITPKGEVLQSLPPLVEGYLVEDVAFIEETTLYTQIGETFVFLCLLGTTLPFLFPIVRYFKKKG